MSIEIQIAYNNFPRIRKNAKAGARKIVLDTSKKVHTHILASMLQPKHGRVYRRRGRYHRASAPGEAPARDWGNYYKSIRNKWASGTSGTQWAGNYTRLVYTKGVPGKPDLPIWLERGTSRMKKRPHFKPAAKKYRSKFQKDMKQYLKRIGAV